MQVAAGELDSVDEIAAILEKSTGPRHEAGPREDRSASSSLQLFHYSRLCR